MCYLYFFCLHCCLINIHIFDYPDSRLSGLFTEVPTSPDKGKNPAWVMMKMLLFNRPDANQGNLRSAAYEALMELIKNSAKVSRIVKKKIKFT